MVRSLWIAAVVVGLAWTGLAWAQPSSSPGGAPPDRYMTVREEGKPAQRCKLLKTWREANGTTAFQVQAVDSGELMTIVESGPAPAGQQARAIATRIFRWGRDNKLPEGSPVPPPTATVMGTPLGQPGPQIVSSPLPVASPAPVVLTPRPAPAPLLTPAPRPVPVATVSAPMFAQPYSSSSSGQPNKPSITVVTPVTSSVAKTTPIVSTMLSPNPVSPPIVPLPARKPEVRDATPVVATPEPRLVPTASGTVDQTPCDSCCQSSCVCCTPPMRQSWISRIFKSNPTPTVVAPIEASKPAAPPTPAKLVAKVATESAQPSDWRKSWGKIEPWKAAPQASSERTSDPPTKQVVRTPIQIDPPQQPDPLKDPDWYRGVALRENLPNSTVREETVSAVPSRKENKSLRSKLLSGGRKPPEIGTTQGANAPRSGEIGTTQGAYAPRSGEMGTTQGANAPRSGEMGTTQGAYAPRSGEM
ncbi:MAG: hypothetical protein ACYC6M_16370, partial [Terriglobales bacterium]